MLRKPAGQSGPSCCFASKVKIYRVCEKGGCRCVLGGTVFSTRNIQPFGKVVMVGPEFTFWDRKKIKMAHSIERYEGP